MAEVIKMPKMSDTMEEGVIASWLVKEGDKVQSGDILAEVETDKATMELESYEDGTLLYIGVKEKDAVPVNGVIAIIGEEGENIDELLKDIKDGGDSSDDEDEKKEEESSEHKEESSEDDGAIDTSDINASIITMPKMSDTMTEGTIASWQKKEGDKVESGDILAEVETDKATMELEAYEDGTLLHIGVQEGDAVEVDGVLAIIGEKGADWESLLKAHKASQKKDSKEEKKEEGKQESTSTSEDKSSKKESSEDTSQKATQDTATDGGRIKASPLAKKMAEEKGYNLSKIPGSGDNGRIVKRDVENYTPAKEAIQEAAAEEGTTFNIPQVVGEESYEEQNVSQMRKTIAKRLAESKFTAPHFYLTMEINMDKAIEARKSMNEYAPIKISFNDIVIKAVAAALRQHPKVNSSWLGDKIRYNKHVHIGVAVAVDEGLLVPVVRFADSKNLSHISAEVKQLAKKATDKGFKFTFENIEDALEDLVKK